MIKSRPHPVIEIGAVDDSVAIIVCDLELPDSPIVYASDAFCQLTGYHRSEVMGRNCRFLQTPGPGSTPSCKATAAIDKPAVQMIRKAVYSQNEIQLRVTNYKRNGQRFTNLLSVIPVQSPNGHHYSVGFQMEL
jgi:PAS domain S-box-containing protein